MKETRGIQKLFHKYLNGDCSEEGFNEFFDELKLPQHEDELRQLIRMELGRNDETDARIDGLLDSVDSRIIKDIHAWREIALVKDETNQKVVRIWPWLLTSAACLLILSLTSFI